MDATKMARVRELEQKLGDIFKRYPPSGEIPPAIAAEARRHLDEINSLLDRDGKALQNEWQDTDHYLNAPVNRPRQPGGDGGGGGGGLFGTPYTGKDIGTLFTESKAFRNFDAGQRQSPTADIEVKALLNTTGWLPESPRLGRIEPGVSPPLTVLDLFNPGRTTFNSVPYMRETTSTSGAVETAEGGTKGESTLAFTLVDCPVRTIATVLPITNQLLEDVSACRDYVNGRLGYFVRRRLDLQLLAGDGIAPNLLGIASTPSVQTQAKGADPAFDAIMKAITKIQVNGGYEPTGIAIHPNDWESIKLTRTADGIYILAHPAEARATGLWSLPVVSTTACTENTAIVGAFKTAAQPFFRSDLQIAVSDSHSDFFIRNQLMIRAEIRIALAVFRPEAFCMVSGV